MTRVPSRAGAPSARPVTPSSNMDPIDMTDIGLSIGMVENRCQSCGDRCPTVRVRSDGRVTCDYCTAPDQSGDQHDDRTRQDTDDLAPMPDLAQLGFRSVRCWCGAVHG